jgi:hypothetical protein
MYTVIRFVAGSQCSTDQLEHLGLLLNESVPDCFKRLDRIGGRFSISISSDDTWSEHELALANFIRSAMQMIIYARSQDVSVEVDVAVEPEDITKAAYLSFSVSPSFLETIGRERITLGFTISNPTSG